MALRKLAAVAVLRKTVQNVPLKLLLLIRSEFTDVVHKACNDFCREHNF